MERISGYIILFTWLVLAGCGAASQHPLQPDGETVTPIAGPATMNGPVNTSYPGSENYSSNIFTNGHYHHDEVLADVESGRWFGLFRNQGTYYLQQTSLLVSREFDSAFDREGEKTGWHIRSSSHDTCVVMIEAFPIGLGNYAVGHAELPADKVYPGDTVSFTFKDREYFLHATGHVENSGDRDGLSDISHYRLFLSSPGLREPTLLVAHPGFDYTMVRLMFAGDLDNDGQPDLILDTSRHYSQSVITVYMSSVAGQDQLVAPVGEHVSTGC